MSWSISLGGPKEAVLKELAEAQAVIANAEESLRGMELGEKDTVNASVSGYVSWDEKGNVTSASTSHSISVTRYQPPKPVEDKTDAVYEEQETT